MTYVFQLPRLTYQSRYSKAPRVDIDSVNKKEHASDDDADEDKTETEHVLTAEGRTMLIS